MKESIEYIYANHIYHYCSLKKTIEHILPTKQLLLSPIEQTNDPRENKELSFSMKASNIDRYKKINSDVNNELKGDCKLICFSSDRNGRIKGYEYSRMWSLYGDNHQGVCIDINETKFIKENKERINIDLFRKVKYEDASKQLRIDLSDAERVGVRKYVREIFRPNHIDDLFFTKNEEWQSENEIRLLHFSDDPEKEYCSIANSINRIILGIDFNENYLPSIISSARDIQVDKLFYTNGRLFPKGMN